jgi:hypothetical protein
VFCGISGYLGHPASLFSFAAAGPVRIKLRRGRPGTHKATPRLASLPKEGESKGMRRCGGKIILLRRVLDGV